MSEVYRQRGLGAQVRCWDEVEFETGADKWGRGLPRQFLGRAHSARVRNSPQIAANPTNQPEPRLFPQIQDSGRFAHSTLFSYKNPHKHLSLDWNECF